MTGQTSRSLGAELGLRTLCGVACLLWTAAGCRSGAPPTKPAGKPLVLVGTSTNDESWVVIRAAASAFAREYQSVPVRVVAPESGSASAQAAMVNDLRREEVSAVCVLVNDPESVRAAVEALCAAGRPVVAMGRDIPGSQRTAYCGPSEFDLGLGASRACEEVLRHRPAKSVILLHAGSDRSPFLQRYAGFQEGVARWREGELIRALDCEGHRVDALRLVQSESPKYPRVGAWVWLDDWPLRAAASGARLLPEGVGLVVCSGEPRHFAALREGRIDALVGYALREVVDRALRAAMHLRTEGATGELFDFTAPVEVVTRESLADYESRWLGLPVAPAR